MNEYYSIQSSEKYMKYICTEKLKEQKETMDKINIVSRRLILLII